MDLYACLDVPCDASPSAIKKAYRKRAKVAHPDAGGNVKDFNALTKAYDVLRDSERRRRYDTTGDETESSPDNSQAEIFMTISMHLDRIVTSSLQYDQPVTKVDIIKALSISLSESVADLDKQKGSLERSLKTYRSILNRFTRKDKMPSVVDSIVRGKIHQGEDAIEELVRREGVVLKAKKIVEAETFRVDPVESLKWVMPKSLDSTRLWNRTV